MHSCICLTFALLCINVSSKPIQEDAKLHLFDFSPQCFLKYTSRLPEKLDAKSHHRWGKVTLIAFFLDYLHCMFLSVYSNCVPVRMQSHLVTFVWLFSTVCIQMSPQMDCHRGFILQSHNACIGSIFLHCGGIITLIAFVWFFCTVYYKMLTQRSWIRAGKVALVAFVWLSSRVRFQMCPQMACPRTTDFQNFYVCGKNQTYVGIPNDYLNYHVCCFLPHMHGFAKYLRYVKVFPNTGWYFLYLFG